jgi:osmotically-inducible protein OsmY
MLRVFLRIVLFVVLLVVVLAAGAFVLASRAGRGGEPGATATSGRAIDPAVAREKGAAIGEKFASVANAAGDAMSDAAITAKIKSKMALDDTIKSRDIHVATSDAVVTLSGKVASTAERDRAMQLARETEGVKSVNDKMEVAAGLP